MLVVIPLPLQLLAALKHRDQAPSALIRVNEPAEVGHARPHPACRCPQMSEQPMSLGHAHWRVPTLAEMMQARCTPDASELPQMLVLRFRQMLPFV